MITTGNVIEQGTQVFTPILERLLEIAQEFVPYLIYIAIWTLWVNLLWQAVKYILWYLKGKSEWTFENREKTRWNKERRMKEYKKEWKTWKTREIQAERNAKNRKKYV